MLERKLARVGAALTTTLAAGLPAPAAAERRFARPEIPAAGPVLAGDRVAWAEEDDRGMGVVVASVRRGTPRRVRALPPDPGIRRVPRLAAGPGILLFGSVGYYPQPSGGVAERSLLLGPPGGSLGPPDPCGVAGARGFAVGGSVVAYRRCDTGALAVRDLARRVPARDLAAPGAGVVRLAGRYLALREPVPDRSGGDTPPSRLVVHDLVADRVAYRLPAARVGAELVAFDVQADGTVAFAYRRDPEEPARVAWASLREPWPHRVALRPTGMYDVRVRRGVVAYQRGARGGRFFSNGEVGVAPLGGRARRVARGVQGRVPPFAESFDFDGRRLTWIVGTCRGFAVRVASVRERVDPGAPRSGCRLRFRSRPYVDRGAVVIAPSCAGFVERDCHTTLRVTTAGRRPVTLTRTRTAYGERPVRLPLRPRGAALLRRRGPVDAVVRAQIAAPGAFERRRASVVIGQAR